MAGTNSTGGISRLVSKPLSPSDTTGITAAVRSLGLRAVVSIGSSINSPSVSAVNLAHSFHVVALAPRGPAAGHTAKVGSPCKKRGAAATRSARMSANVTLVLSTIVPAHGGVIGANGILASMVMSAALTKDTSVLATLLLSTENSTDKGTIAVTVRATA